MVEKSLTQKNMNILGYALLFAGGVGSLICAIIVIIKMFKTQESPLMGILGILCGLWAFIWGWMNASKYGLGKIMKLWTLALVVSVIGNVIVSASVMKQINDGTMPKLESTTSP
jgi:hypothetical protein